VIRIGIIGCNYGRQVHLPAFRQDSRCSVMALAGSDAARTADIARASDIPHAFGDWRALVESPDVDAITIATPPELQPSIAVRALGLGKAVFAEKPMAADVVGAEAMVKAATSSGRANAIDFNFSAIPAWQKAKELLDQGAIGRLRHVAVSWHVENQTTRMRLKNWKSSGNLGGGALGNFVSHSFHYLEWLYGPIQRLSAHLSGPPDAADFETNAAISMVLQSGAAGSIVMSGASYNGSGHRVEFYGEDGTLSLINATRDYMRGFELRLARRPEDLSLIEVDDPLDRRFPEDGRIAPVARLSRRFLDAIEEGEQATPGFAEGLRVQVLLDAARASNRSGSWVDVSQTISGSYK
jgi:predicted dehydrogenase